MDPRRLQRVAGLVSLVSSVVILGAKFVGWRLTGSTALLSDALESIVNVVAAAFALWSVRLSRTPADADHPYGHGKIEYVSAAFEGGLIALAGLLILYEAAQRLIFGGALENLGVGATVTGAAALANLALGAWLVRVGRRTGSMALVADGHHVLSDVWTSLLGLAALGLVAWTGRGWFDPIFAGIAAVNLLWVGARLLRDAVAGILDVADPRDLATIDAALRALQEPALRGWGQVRSRHQGHLHHVDLTVYVPGAMRVEEAHALSDRVEAVIRQALVEAEVLCHVEPETPGQGQEQAASNAVSDPA